MDGFIEGEESQGAALLNELNPFEFVFKELPRLLHSLIIYLWIGFSLRIERRHIWMGSLLQNVQNDEEV